MAKKQILLTNDDGIRSPGLWAAAEALSEIAYVTVAAPREQSSGMGRSMPSTTDCRIDKEIVHVNGQDWTVYAVGGSPAQAVQYGTLLIMDVKPDLVVSGINYGENLALGVSISGTVGAAMEAVALGIPALAISLETDMKHHLSYSNEVDFSSAAYFAALFAGKFLERDFPEHANLLKVDVPRDATPETPWQTSRLSPYPYYHSVVITKDDGRKEVSYDTTTDFSREPHNSDVYILNQRREVAVTPLTLDFTARVNLDDFDKFLRT